MADLAQQVGVDLVAWKGLAGAAVGTQGFDAHALHECADIVSSSTLVSAPSKKITLQRQLTDIGEKLRQVNRFIFCDGAPKTLAAFLASPDQPCKVEFDGRNFKFASEYEFSLWFMREVVPIAERVARQ